MSPRILTSLAFLGAAAALNTACAPGGNFDLSIWDLQLPVDNGSGQPTTIQPSSLEGCAGYQDPGHKYFFTESTDGAMVMKVYGSPASVGCVTTTNSQHCRTELREISPSSWSPYDTNVMTVSLVVTNADDSEYGTVIGQVHIDDSISSKPVCELYYSASGALTMGVEQTRSGGDEKMIPVGNIPLGQVFSYTLSYTNNVLSIALNGGAAQTLSTYSLDAPNSYFKVGNYNQGDNLSDVHFFSISVEH